MEDVLKKLGDIGLIPVIKLNSPDEALPLGKALLAGSLPVAEITFRTDAAHESIKILSRELPDLVLGAGTVLTPGQVDTAVAAGARYIVTPGFNPKVVEYCQKKGIPVTPGVTTPSQIEQALEYGLKVLKFFPAENSGGVGMLKAFAGPYGDKVSFIPTGGVSEKNLADYLALPNVHAVGGSWMVPGKLIEAGDFAAVEKLCREARILSLGFSLLHLGLNPDGNDTLENAKFLSSLLGMPSKDGPTSAFVGHSFEIMKSTGRGEHGHIAIETVSVERALEWLSGFGIKPVEETVKTKGGRIQFAYLDRPFMGFALHLNRRQ
jgi:2-dehydro-3-deoxyphosphogluconate aldolase/(4S)-4-hydroxy-2-oxoglutarate aldolase